MYLILMVYACLISCSLINKSKCHSLAYFNLRWTCVVILHKHIYMDILSRVCIQLHKIMQKTVFQFIFSYRHKLVKFAGLNVRCRS